MNNAQKFIDFAQQIARAADAEGLNVSITIKPRVQKAEPAWRNPRIARLQALLRAIDAEIAELEFNRTYVESELRERIAADRAASATVLEWRK